MSFESYKRKESYSLFIQIYPHRIFSVRQMRDVADAILEKQRELGCEINSQRDKESSKGRFYSRENGNLRLKQKS